jgi:hypothetical protein
VTFDTSPVHQHLPLNINKHIGFPPDFGHQVAVIDADGWKLIDDGVVGFVENYDGIELLFLYDPLFNNDKFILIRLVCSKWNSFQGTYLYLYKTKDRI